MSWRRWRGRRREALGESGRPRGAWSRNGEGGSVRTRLLDGCAWKPLRPPEFRTFYFFSLQKDGVPESRGTEVTSKQTGGETPGLAPCGTWASRPIMSRGCEPCRGTSSPLPPGT
jgi:hypothetical protein